MLGYELLKRKIISAGLCTGCGTCIGVCPRESLEFDYDEEEPFQTGKCSEKCRVCIDVCPGENVPKPQLDKMLFGRERDQKSEKIGIATSHFKGHANEENIREQGASGGCVTGLLVYALENDIVDAVIVAGMDPDRPWRVKPILTDNIETIRRASQSKLTIVPTNSMLKGLNKTNYERIGVVGLPCHIHGIRKMQEANIAKSINKKIKFTLGLLCGANWTYRGTEHLIQEVCEMQLDEVRRLEYRGGAYPGNFRVSAKDGRVKEVLSVERRMFCMGFLRDRCTMCYDYSNEFADISIGDYFDHSMKRGNRGWSALTVRTSEGDKLLKDAEKDGYLTIETISSDYSIGNIGFEFKMHGYGYHIQTRKKCGWPTPDYGYPLQTDVLPRKVHLKHPHTTGAI